MTANKPYDLTDDAPRYVVEALAAVREQDPKRMTSSDDLANAWVLPRPNNYIELRAEYADEVDEKRSEVGEFSVKEWLIDKAIVNINANNGGSYQEVIVRGDTDNYRLNEDVDVSTLKLRGEPLFLETSLPDLFTPETGLWADNFGRGEINESDPKDKELIQSLKAFGWPQGLEAVHDEHGVSLMGGRREAVAKMLGITPVVRVITFGDGPAADAARAALKVASNMGNKPFTPEQRKQIAQDLYNSGKFVITEIAEKLHVSAMTISRDLSGLTNVKPPPERGGRPRRSETPTPTPPAPTPAPTPEPEPEPEPATTPDGMTDLGWAEDATTVKQEPVDEPINPGPWLGTILHSVTEFADWAEELDADERAQFAKHTPFVEMLAEISQQVQRTIQVVRNGISRTPKPTAVADDDEAVGKVAKRIVKWLTENGASTSNVISQKALYGPNAKKGILGNRRFFDAALKQLVGAGMVVAADGQIELGQEEAGAK